MINRNQGSQQGWYQGICKSERQDAVCVFFFSSRRRHTRLQGDWSSDVCSSDLSIETECAFVLVNFPRWAGAGLVEDKRHSRDIHLELDFLNELLSLEKKKR